MRQIIIPGLPGPSIDEILNSTPEPKAPTVPTTVHKFPLDIIDDPQPIPAGYEVLFVADQGGTLTLWAQSGFSCPEQEVVVVGTGHPIPEGGWQWRGSALMAPFVWHVFGRYL